MANILLDAQNLVGELYKAGGFSLEVFQNLVSNGDKIVITTVI